MEKSSEKIIGSNKISPNPFNNLLSEVQLKINQPKSSKKIENYALQIDSNIDRSNSNINFQPHQPSKKENHLQANSKMSHHHVYVINAPLKTKNSSDTNNKEKSQKEIIDEWIVGYMGKRQILGTHWEENLASKQRLFMEMAFKMMKENSLTDIKQNGSLPQNLSKLSSLFNQLQKKSIRICFNFIKQFYKDDLLFGLSNTIGEERDHSLMLKVDNEYEALSIQSKQFKKEAQNKKHQQFSFSDRSQSNKNLTNKGSQSNSPSEDLSNLILNHNKLKFSEQLNKSTPNIPRIKTSQKSIKTNKEINELCLETKKHINTPSKQGDEFKSQELPLQSNKHLIPTRKDIIEQPQVKASQKQQEKLPITITFIMKNLETASIIKGQQDNHIKTAEIKQQPNKNIPHHLQNPMYSDQNIINKLPFAESFYQNVRGNTRPLTFVHADNQKRSTSLQIKPGYVPLFPQNNQIIANNNSIKRFFANQYYPEQSNRQSIRLIRENLVISNQKARPKSATPKITFTFTSSGSSQAKIPVTGVVKNNPTFVPIQNTIPPPQYDNHDYILESVLNHPQVVKPAVVNQRTKHKFQVVSPSSRNAQSPKRIFVPPNKMALDNRQHIKNNILPPAFNDYGTQKPQKSFKTQKSNGKITFMDNEIIYQDNFQKSTAQNSIFACSSKQSNLNGPSKDQNRMKSPKDKIFVTYANRCNF